MTENHKECGGGRAMRVKLNFIDFAASCKKFNDSILKNRTKTNKFQGGGGEGLQSKQMFVLQFNLEQH